MMENLKEDINFWEKKLEKIIGLSHDTWEEIYNIVNDLKLELKVLKVENSKNKKNKFKIFKGKPKYEK